MIKIIRMTIVNLLSWECNRVQLHLTHPHFEISSCSSFKLDPHGRFPSFSASFFCASAAANKRTYSSSWKLKAGISHGTSKSRAKATLTYIRYVAFSTARRMPIPIDCIILSEHTQFITVQLEPPKRNLWNCE